MNELVSISKIKKHLKTSEFYLQCKIPMGYTTGFPILQKKNEKMYLLFPFLKYQTTGEVDRTQVFPIRYIISMELPAENIVLFKNLEYDERFQKVDFDKPIGLFRHESIQRYNKKQYQDLYNELMELYDKTVNSYLFHSELSEADSNRMRELLQLMAEPSLHSIYRILDKEFYEEYLH